MTASELDRLPDEVWTSIPDGEEIYWHGQPDWRSLGYHAFGCKYLVLYFIISAFYAVSQIKMNFSFNAFFGQYVTFVISGVVAGAILFLLAYVAARHTCYVITEKRVVIRTGIALVFLLNVPLKNIISIDKQSLWHGRGNLSFKSRSKKRIPYLSCWPSVKSGSLLEPIPIFRSILNIEEIGNLVGEMAAKNLEWHKLNETSDNSGVAA